MRLQALLPLLNRAELAQFHDFSHARFREHRDIYRSWMRDRQMLTDLIAELAGELRK